MESMPEELFDDRNRAVVGICGVPNVCPPLRIALASFVRAREGPLVILINDLPIFHNHTYSLEVNLIVIHHHVIQRVVLLVFDPFTLAGSL